MSAAQVLIDVWDIDTFDADLCSILGCNADLIRNYMLTSRRQWLEREASDGIMPYPENPHAGEFLAMTERAAGLMERRTIRSWHYTRMTDEEVELLRQDGIHLSTLDAIRERLPHRWN